MAVQLQRRALLMPPNSAQDMASALSSSSSAFPTNSRSFFVLRVSDRAHVPPPSELPPWRASASPRQEPSEAASASLSDRPKPKEADAELSPPGPLSPSSASSSGKGFGRRPSPPPPKPTKPVPTSRDRKSAVSRRPAPGIPPAGVQSPDPVLEEQDKVFVYGLAILGVVIFIQGILLAGSGFLSDELDALVVKYVYPSFTPTVGLFLAGAVLYGVFKVRQGGDKPDQS